MKTRILALLAANALVMPGNVFAQILPPPPERPRLDANGVDVQSAEMQYSQNLMSIGPKGIGGLDYTISYSGRTWRHSFSNLLYEESGTFITLSDTISVGNDSESFSADVPNNGNGSTLSGYSYSRRDGTFVPFTHYVAGGYDPGTGITTVYNFADYLEYPNGVRLTFNYRDDTGSGYLNTRLQSVTTNTGYQMKFYYQIDTETSPSDRIAWTTVTKVVAIDNAVEYCDPYADSCSVSSSWPQVQFSSGFSTVTDPLGNQTQFDATYPNFKIKTADSAVDNIIYLMGTASDSCTGGLDLKVTSATINGRATTYSYSESGGNATVVSSSPLSQQFTYVSTQATGAPGLCRFGVNSVTDPLGRTTTFGYDYSGRLLSTVSPEGNHAQNVIDGVSTPPPDTTRGNITQDWLYPKPSSGSPTLTESRTFPSCFVVSQKVCNQPDTYTDPRGNVTSYTYDTNSGGVLIETDPADSNGIQPVKRYAYAQRYAWIKDALGAYVQAPTAVWLRTEERTCATTATVGSACAGGSPDEIVTSYDYGPNSGPNNLLLRGMVVTASGVSLRTCYGYDPYGNKISETSPRAGLTSCP